MKGKSFCPQCGKTDEELFDGLCRSCFIENLTLISVPDKIEITTCTQCGSIQKKGRWIDSELSLEDQIAETLLEHVDVDNSVSNIEISLEILNIRGSTFEFLIGVKGQVLGEIVSQDFPVEIKAHKNVCTECSRYASGYYEAVIQLRANERHPSPEEIEIADKILKKQIEQLSEDNRMAYISQRAQIKEGVDYYVGSYKVARKLTDVLKNELGGVSKESPRLMGRDKSTGKDLYRIWISLRLPQFLKLDFVEYNDLIAQVRDYDGSKVNLKDLESTRRISLPWRDSEKLKVVASKEDIKPAMVTAKTPQYIQILHPETYQPVDIEINSEISDVEIGDEIDVVEINGILFPLNS